MAVTIKRLAQTALNNTVTTRYTAPTGVTTQIVQIFLVNNGSVDRSVDIHQGGTAITNRILRNIVVPADGSLLLQDLCIVVSAGQIVAAKQDTGTDIVLTIYGVEEN